MSPPDPIARLRELAEKKNRCAREGPESLREGCESEAALLNDAADALAQCQQRIAELEAELIAKG